MWLSLLVYYAKTFGLFDDAVAVAIQ